MYYIESPSIDPQFNLALEQYLFEQMPRDASYFMLWQNDRSVIIGKNQCESDEVNEDFAEENGIQVVRRLSGGGAVYHDLGNVNFTFIVNGTGGDVPQYEPFCTPVIEMLEGLRVSAVSNGRNDLLVDGKKFSGNAQYHKDGRILHHGTVMFDVDLGMMQGVLKLSEEKKQRNGVSSVRGRVTNIRQYVNRNMTTKEFMQYFGEYMIEKYGLLKIS